MFKKSLPISKCSRLIATLFTRLITRFFTSLIAITATSMLLTTISAQAFLTEFSTSYSRKKTTFDEYNYVDSESSTIGLSFYFMERLATELSYTYGYGIRSEKASVTDPTRTILQRTEVTGLDIILMLSDRKATVQPYVKTGVAQLVRKQEVKIEGFASQILTPDNAYIPSYGLGLKLALSDVFNIKFSYDVWQTPVSNDIKTDDAAIRVGLSWYL